MGKFKLMLVLTVVMQFACGAVGGSVTSSPGAEPSTATALTTPPIASEAALMPSSTVEPTLPTLIPPAAIVPESFGQAKVLHEYWPVIRKELGLFETIRFGTSHTAWALSPDGRYVVVAGCDVEAGDGTLDQYIPTDCQLTNSETSSHAYLVILDADTEKVIAKLPETGLELTVTDLYFTHDSSKLIYVVSTHGGFENWNEHHTLKIWDIGTGQIDSTFEDVGTVAISPDDRWLLLPFGNQPGSYKIWDLTLKESVKEVKLPFDGFPAVFSADGQRLLIYNDPYLTIYDTNSWQPVIDQAMMPSGVNEYYDVSPDLSLLAICRTVTPDQPVRIFDIATGTQVQTLQMKFGKCGRLFFSPDGKYLLLFNNHGAGPMAWKVDGWKLFNWDLYALAPFVHTEDEFVDRMEASQDGKTLLVGTFTRLTLYGLPEAVPQPEVANAPTATASIVTPAAPPPTRRHQYCHIIVTGWVKLDVEPCMDWFASAGRMEGDNNVMTIDIGGEDPTGVTIDVPLYLAKRLKPGKYEIGERGEEYRLYADFHYSDPVQNTYDIYENYLETGEIVFTETGTYFSGSFKFGAHTYDGKEANVEGTFENIPFNPVNMP